MGDESPFPKIKNALTKHDIGPIESDIKPTRAKTKRINYAECCALEVAPH